MTKTTTITTDEVIAALVNSIATEVDRIDAATKPAHSKHLSRARYRPTASLLSLKAFIEKAIGFASAAELRAAAADLRSFDDETAAIIEKAQR
ncbi:hypothetical protein [Zeimonas arvi]|uniref:Uncharacterized protein n=1 Tax=Zeimonas arvi TaxID=2498847 RepID=A0A5C8NQG7_9BURK|nr:hypothetical protein [Zeimonas arvi]TXL63562.1 hypothetical protein FHP08_17150 [Zeimonas arvi]